MTKSENENSLIQLSVIVVSISSQSSLGNCLDAIISNENQDAIEIIAAGCGSDKSVSDLVEKYPNVHFLRFPQKTGIPVLSAAGIARATGEIIALTDSSCVADSNWIASILKAHQSPSLAVGGAVEISREMKLLDLAAYFCDYAQFMRPLKSGAADALPGNNISFKRPALAIGNEYVKNEFWKTFWCRKLQAEGFELTAEPAMLVYYTKEFKPASFLFRRFHHGRCFAGMRAKQMSFFKRTIYVAGSLFLPFILLYRTIAAVLRKKRLHKELLFSFPFIVLAIVFWSLGEMCGYLAGTGKSCDYIY